MSGMPDQLSSAGVERHIQLAAWVRERLRDRGWTALGEPRVVRARPWATVLRQQSGGGVVWAKAAAPAFGYEIRLLELLDRHAPGATARVLALDADRRFALLADAGPTLDVVHAAGLGPQPSEPQSRRAVEAWTAMLEKYALVQQALAPRLDELLAAGLPDLRPGPAAAAFAELVNRPGLLRVGGAHGISASEAAAVRARGPLAARAAERLAGSAIPASVQHDDLQPGNAVRGGALIDWGDASVAHPFASLLTALNGSAGRPAARFHARIRDAYLEQFADGADLDDLREQARLAVLLAPAGRILAWLRVPEALELYPDAVTLWWRRILADRNWDRLR